MPFRPLELPAAAAERGGRVWLSSMPGRLEPWAEFLAEARRTGLHDVLCLNPLFEVERLSPAYAKAIEDGSLPFDWTHLPMQDFGLAAEALAYRDTVLLMAERVRGGRSLLLHCAAGIGRTGTTAACLLKSLGASAPLALRRVREAGSNPESALQQGLIDRF
ncbi:MAG: tyrosine-protein phosphatase [Proteobacteria bacterium]|nr:tyrosine-protein phosphatase [Pseudomonadota bacterium]